MMDTHERQPSRSATDEAAERGAGRLRGEQAQSACIAALRQAIEHGRPRLIGAVWADYDHVETHRYGNRFDAELRLIGLTARVEVRVPLHPPTGGHAPVPEGYELELEAGGGGAAGLWLRGEGIDPEDPPDVLGEALAAEDPLAVGIALAEVRAHHTFRTREGWSDLRLSCEVAGAGFLLTHKGVEAVLTLDLAAEPRLLTQHAPALPPAPHRACGRTGGEGASRGRSGGGFGGDARRPPHRDGRAVDPARALSGTRDGHTAGRAEQRPARRDRGRVAPIGRGGMGAAVDPERSGA